MYALDCWVLSWRVCFNTDSTLIADHLHFEMLFHLQSLSLFAFFTNLTAHKLGTWHYGGAETKACLLFLFHHLTIAGSSWVWKIDEIFCWWCRRLCWLSCYMRRRDLALLCLWMTLQRLVLVGTHLWDIWEYRFIRILYIHILSTLISHWQPHQPTTLNYAYQT